MTDQEIYNRTDECIARFKNGKESSYFYILQFDRSAFKDRLDEIDPRLFNKIFKVALPYFEI